MDSRDILILGAVVVAGFFYWRARNNPGVPTSPGAGVGGGAMTSSGAASTSSAGAARQSQLGAGLGPSFAGFSTMNMNPYRFSQSAAVGIVTDSIAPTPVSRPPVMSSPTVVGGAGVFGVGASGMGPQPRLTTTYPGTRY